MVDEVVFDSLQAFERKVHGNNINLVRVLGAYSTQEVARSAYVRVRNNPLWTSSDHDQITALQACSLLFILPSGTDSRKAKKRARAADNQGDTKLNPAGVMQMYLVKVLGVMTAKDAIEAVKKIKAVCGPFALLWIIAELAGASLSWIEPAPPVSEAISPETRMASSVVFVKTCLLQLLHKVIDPSVLETNLLVQSLAADSSVQRLLAEPAWKDHRRCEVFQEFDNAATALYVETLFKESHTQLELAFCKVVFLNWDGALREAAEGYWQRCGLSLFSDTKLDTLALAAVLGGMTLDCAYPRYRMLLLQRVQKQLGLAIPTAGGLICAGQVDIFCTWLDRRARDKVYLGVRFRA